MHIRKVRVDNKLLEQVKWDAMRSDLHSELAKEGFTFVMDEPAPRSSIDFHGIRLSTEWMKEHGHNVSPFTGRRGNVLGWKDWVRFNNAVNKVMDKYNISANVSSLGGKFKIREGRMKYTEDDWEGLADENVGSMMSPVSRRDAWRSER